MKSDKLILAQGYFRIGLTFVIGEFHFEKVRGKDLNNRAYLPTL